MQHSYRPKLTAGGKIRRQRHETGLDLLNKQFGMLTVVALHGRDKWQSKVWKCRCDYCGGTSYATTGNLRSGNSQSCGCQKVAAIQGDVGGRAKTHALLQQRLKAIPWPASVQAIANAVFDGDRQKAAKWASANVKANYLVKVARGLYDIRRVSTDGV
jgi:hypothetical protein